jgi:hypothetical protein
VSDPVLDALFPSMKSGEPERDTSKPTLGGTPKPSEPPAKQLTEAEAAAVLFPSMAPKPAEADEFFPSMPKTAEPAGLRAPEGMHPTELEAFTKAIPGATQAQLDAYAKVQAVRTAEIEAETVAWEQQVRADKELSLGFDENISEARGLLDEYGTPALKQWLAATGIGNHPSLSAWRCAPRRHSSRRGGDVEPPRSRSPQCARAGGCARGQAARGVVRRDPQKSQGSPPGAPQGGEAASARARLLV